MSYMRRPMFLLVFGTCVAILGPGGADAQQASRNERLREPSVQSDLRSEVDDFRSRPRGRITISDGSPAFRPPIATLPIQSPAQDRWQLGVHAEETDTGMLITNVIRGSAADRAGLERGDRIVAVGSERVGIVGNRTVSMRNVLRRKADSRGRVSLLMEPRRHRGLINVSVNLDGVGGTQIFGN